LAIHDGTHRAELQNVYPAGEKLPEHLRELAKGLERQTTSSRRSRTREQEADTEIERAILSGVNFASMPINARHRDKNGEISRKHGDTLIRTLRRTYGPTFAKGCADDDTLGDVLHKLDEPSLSHLIRDHEAGDLEQICRAA
jgi:hypothetical protein